VSDLVGFVLFIGTSAVLLGGFAWLGSRVRHSGVGGGLMGPIDEMYNPGAHRSRLEIQVQEQRMAPMASPEDRLRAQPGPEEPNFNWSKAYGRRRRILGQPPAEPTVCDSPATAVSTTTPLAARSGTGHRQGTSRTSSVRVRRQPACPIGGEW